jgi:two-component system, sensor histidine kinase LadS
VRVAIAMSVVIVFLLPVPVVVALRHRYRPARFVALGYAVILPGGAMLSLRMLDLLPGEFWIEHAVQFGTALEALLLSFALADRITLLTREKAAAQASLIEAERDALALQRAFSERLLDVQDKERKRIAAELHDGVGQNLVVLVNKLKRLVNRGGDAGSAADCGRLEEIARGMVQELRGVAHALYPHQLDRLGLEAALEQVVERTLEPADIAYECELAIQKGLLPKPAEIHVYRIVQEALCNIVRHAGATRVKATAEEEDGALRIRIEDDGRGLAGEPGFGLASMEQRAKLLGATLAFEPQTPHGLAIDLCVPLKAVP